MKAIESSEWQYILKALLSLQINAADAKAFVVLIEKIEHQGELSIKREQKKMEST